MKKEAQIQYVEAVFKGLEAQKKKEDADGITHQIDVKRYVSNERLEKEKEILFKNYPIVVGAAAKLKDAGDYFLHDETGLPIMVIKGKDGAVRAFLNMCRHRGVRLLEEVEGKVKTNIVCPYHAWSYDNQGCLRKVFHPQGFEKVDASTHSLIELDCWIRLGMVFVVPNPEMKGKFDIDSYLSEVYSITEGFDFGEMIPHDPRSSELACNWKLLVDGGLEGYHFKIAHSKTIGPYFLDNMTINTANKLHSSVIFPKRFMKKFQELPQSDWNFRKSANILIHLFPNTIILIEPDHVMVVSNFPLDAKTTLSKSFMLLPKEVESQKEKDYWDLNANIFWTAINEDNEMAELQQKSLNEYSDSPMTVGSYEKLLLQFENLVDQALEGELGY